MSTDYEPEQVPSVPVCSLQCEDKYLASMGFCAVGSRGRSVIDTMKQQLTADGTRDGDDAMQGVCFVCGADSSPGR